MGPFRWIVATLLVAAFLLLSVANWTMVPFLLPQGKQVMVPLPMVIGVAFVAGWLPTWLSQLATAAMLRRRLERAERLLAERQEAPPVAPLHLPPPAEASEV